MNYKVCILAAGIGRRISSSSKIHKALLPIGDIATISRIIEKYDEKINIIIAVGYNKDQIKEYISHAHPKRKIDYVSIDNYYGKGSGPGYSLYKCRNKLKCPFIFTTVDTIVLEDIPKPNVDWVGVAPVKDTKDYCTFKTNGSLVTRIDDKTTNDNRLAFIGIAGIKNYLKFFKSLEQDQNILDGEVQVSSGLKGLINKNLNLEFFTWYDTGNDKNYKITKESFEQKPFDFSKPNEYFYSFNNKIIKLYSDSKKVNFLAKRAIKIKNIIPSNFKSTKNILSYEKFQGEVVYKTLSPAITRNLLFFLEKNLWDFKKRIPPKNFLEICKNFYKNKTLDRITLFRKKYDVKDEKYIINNITYEKLSYYLNKIDWDYICDGVQSQFHGDLQFDNIIYNHSKKNFKLIDWRPDFGGDTSVGDIYYDFAKMYSGCIVQYDEIKKNNFIFNMSSKEINFDYYIKYSVNVAKKDLLKYFITRKYDTKKINIISSLIFLNMSPMHQEPFSHLCYFLGLTRLKESLL